MSKILVCQHVAYEILGTLNPLIKRHGFRIRYVNFDRHPHAQPSLEGYSGLVILGGPMKVDQVAAHPHLRHEIELISGALKMDIPVLGICLGAQLIAKALGAEVAPNPHKEIGWYDITVTDAGRSDPVLGHFDDVEKIFQWHSDTFDVPKGAVHLATSPDCPNQAFRYGDKVYALQFHLECDEPMIERWLRVPLHREELDSLKGQVEPAQILKDTKFYIDRLNSLSEKTFGEFVNLFDSKKKYYQLPSR